jgi:hypothetical protein
MDGKGQLEPNNKANRLKAGFIESVLSGKVHHPQRTGPEKSHWRNCSPVFKIWVKSQLKVLRNAGIG